MKADAPGKKCPKTLPRRSGEPDLDRIRRKPVWTKLFRDHRTKHRASCTIRIFNWYINHDRFTALYRGRRQLDQQMIELLVELVVLFANLSGNVVRRLLVEQLRNIDQSMVRVIDLTLPQLVDPTYHLVHGA